VKLFEQARLGPLLLRNRIVKAATFEGRTPKGRITDDLVDFHTEVARGGAGMTTVAYCAVSPGGRVHRHCAVLDEDAVPGFRRLTDAVHAEGAAAAAQIGHAGLVADTRSNRTRTLAPSTRLSLPAKTVVRAASPAQLAEVTEQFARAARCARAAGFDAVEVHLGHNYLLSSFLSPNLNRRKDDLGGTLERRAAFPRDVVRAVREAAGPGLAVTAKLNMTDGVPGGLWLDESLQVARWLQDDGHLDALQLTGGSSLLNGMYFFRGEVPMREFVDSQPTLVGLGLRVIGRRIFPTYPFEEAFFLQEARQFRAALDMPLVLLGGINRRDTMDRAIEQEGFAFVAMARALLRDPGLPRRLEAGTATEGLCVHCNKCMPTIYSGTRCVIRTGGAP
jgi:2,4-dienoyl-CoA reductase-like NADH-dependent reductase (Old Yellow Enzyme family)